MSEISKTIRTYRIDGNPQADVLYDVFAMWADEVAHLEADLAECEATAADWIRQDHKQKGTIRRLKAQVEALEKEIELLHNDELTTAMLDSLVKRGWKPPLEASYD